MRLRVCTTMRVLLLALAAAAAAHDPHLDPGSAGTDLKERMPNGLTWETWHMMLEHGLDLYDTDLFFIIHDLGTTNLWDRNDILMMYGLLRDEVVGKGDGFGDHDDTEAVSEATRNRVVSRVLELVDTNSDGVISQEEWRTFKSNGGDLPDFGVGVGHHLDFEQEYEVHHWNKHHKDVDPEMTVQHAEDVEHELLHHAHEIEHEESLPADQVAELVRHHQALFRPRHVPKKYAV